MKKQDGEDGRSRQLPQCLIGRKAGWVPCKPGAIRASSVLIHWENITEQGRLGVDDTLSLIVGWDQRVHQGVGCQEFVNNELTEFADRRVVSLDPSVATIRNLLWVRFSSLPSEVDREGVGDLGGRLGGFSVVFRQPLLLFIRPRTPLDDDGEFSASFTITRILDDLCAYRPHVLFAIHHDLSLLSMFENSS